MDNEENLVEYKFRVDRSLEILKILPFKEKAKGIVYMIQAIKDNFSGFFRQLKHNKQLENIPRAQYKKPDRYLWNKLGTDAAVTDMNENLEKNLCEKDLISTEKKIYREQSQKKQKQTTYTDETQIQNEKSSNEGPFQDEENHSKNINSNSIVVPALKDQGTSESNKIPLSKDKQNQLIYNCILCPNTYCLRESLIDHYEVHSGHCYHCGMPNLNTVEDFILHNRTYHHKEFPFACEICKELFLKSQNDKRNYQQHVEETGHKQDSAICTICGAGFNSKNALAKHVNQAHKKDNLFECHICQKKLTRKANLERHVQLHTEVKRTFECDKCGSSYFTHQALREHFIYAHTDVSESKCTLCGKIFSSVKSLQTHLQSEEKLLNCSLCSQTFKRKTYLVRHKQRVHGESSSSSSTKNMKCRSKELGSDGDASKAKLPRKSSKPNQKVLSPPPPSSTTTKPQESPVLDYVTDSATEHCSSDSNSSVNLLMYFYNANNPA